MKVLAVPKRLFVALGLAVALAMGGSLAFTSVEAQALTAGEIASAKPISYILGQAWSPTWYKCYSTAKGRAVLKTKYDQDADFHEFQAALDRSFTKGVKWLTSTTDNVSSYGLKAGKTYYIRFRNFGNKINGSYYNGSGYAYGSWYSNWSAVKAVKICNTPKKKNKMVGKWKLVSANFNKSLVKYNNRHGGKYILTLKKSGKGMMKDYAGAKYAIPSWGITGKKTGVIALSGAPSKIQDYGTIRVSGKKLTLKMKTDAGKTYKMVFKKK